ncbi:hypothetical protein EDD36DRAFT_467857 [Exophiala viscosa]|uniref:MARVEL domain-containing protein n=1 Tax=Exophiala viscosa TaxID=2486360 RepID=A0AAN6DNE3_9EURO|nr:hypothetical protein EDD36DRAFT_467857 [Exophiala viscosa]
MRSRPQVYPRLAFHVVRAIAFISASIVTAILVYFCIQLKHDGYKLPWTFIIVLASTLLSLITLLISSMIYACAFLNPLVNMLVNIPIALIWTAGLAVLTYNMYGTLGHTCSATNWASSDGMMICRTYKALYSFAVFGWLAQIALVVLDVRSRRAQTALGKYNKMDLDANASAKDVKLDNLNRTSTSTLSHSHSHSNSQDIPYGVPEYRENGYSRPAPQQQQQQQHQHQQWTSDRLRMADYNDTHGRFNQQTGYANNGYGYEPQR